MGAVEADLCSRDRDIESGADLEMRPAVEILHDHHRSQARWELTKGLAETAPELELINPALGLRVGAVLGFDDIGERGLLVAGLTAPGGSRRVDRDAVQPGREGGIAPER